MMNSHVVGRFAPSPSGRMHLGNVFSALLAWLSARSQGGSFLLRLEDLDDRCLSEYGAQIEDDLCWLGIDWDGTPVSQHDRSEAYEHALEVVAAQTKVYPCFCSRADLHAASAPHASDGTPLYAGTCRNLSREEAAERAKVKVPALRVAVPEGEHAVCFEDLHMGAVSQCLAAECGDFILRRSDGVFAYQLAVVVDDAAAGITEVVRGSDLLSSTPRQIWLQELLGLSRPAYAHHPMLLAPDGKRLSKREKSLDMGALRELFDSPEEVIGWMALMAGLLDEPRPASASSLIGGFSWDRVRVEDIVVEPFGPLQSIY